jgi:hypothetical protein
MTTLAAFIGGWELLLITVVLGGMIVVPLLIVGIVLFVVNRQKKNALPPVHPSQSAARPTQEAL